MRKAILIIMISVLMMMFLTVFAFADEINLENGSKIIGTIEKFDKKTVQVKTDYAGKLSIDLTKVISFTSDNPLNVSFTDKKRAAGKVTWTKGQVLIQKADGNVFVSRETPEIAWHNTLADPFLRQWNFELGLDMAGKTGNSERISAGGKARAKMQGPDDKLLLSVKYAYAKDDGVNSDNSVLGGVDYEKYFSSVHSLYARVEAEHDRIKGLDFRTTAAAGYGYYFLKTEHHTLRGRTGLMYRYDLLTDDSTESRVGVDFGLSHMYQFANSWKMLNEVVYTPSFKGLEDYQIYHESSLYIPVAASDIWKFELGVSNDYNSTPPADKKYLDTTYFMRLVLNWRS